MEINCMLYYRLASFHTVHPTINQNGTQHAKLPKWGETLFEIVLEFLSLYSSITNFSKFQCSKEGYLNSSQKCPREFAFYVHENSATWDAFWIYDELLKMSFLDSQVFSFERIFWIFILGSRSTVSTHLTPCLSPLDF